MHIPRAYGTNAQIAQCKRYNHRPIIGRPTNRQIPLFFARMLTIRRNENLFLFKKSLNRLSRNPMLLALLFIPRIPIKSQYRYLIKHSICKYICPYKRAPRPRPFYYQALKGLIREARSEAHRFARYFMAYSLRRAVAKFLVHPKFSESEWWARRDLNPRPRRYERPALTTELQAHPWHGYSKPHYQAQMKIQNDGFCYTISKAR